MRRVMLRCTFAAPTCYAIANKTVRRHILEYDDIKVNVLYFTTL
jgi:hypothetical protein